MLAERMETQAVDVEEDVVAHGHYGRRLGIILQGKINIWRDLQRRNAAKSEIVAAENREPVFGLMACLKKASHAKVKTMTQDWVVVAVKFVDMAWVTRTDLMYCFNEAWRVGHEEMMEMALAHYAHRFRESMDVKISRKLLDNDDLLDTEEVLNRQMDSIEEKEKALTDSIEITRKEVLSKVQTMHQDLMSRADALGEKVDGMMSNLKSVLAQHPD
eukprot:SAG11_NODE_1471_length_4843_cov_1.729132_3_plen_216_part_00